MAENLRSTQGSRGKPIEHRVYDDNENLTSAYGLLYTWNAAMAESEKVGAQGVCPDGWRLPSLRDWDALIEHAGGDSSAGGRLKEAGTAHWLSPNAGGGTSSDSGGFLVEGSTDGSSRAWGSEDTSGAPQATDRKPTLRPCIATSRRSSGSRFPRLSWSRCAAWGRRLPIHLLHPPRCRLLACPWETGIP
ncbi:FISUMP domain-containing protein [Gemmatimonadota bacterium]